MNLISHELGFSKVLTSTRYRNHFKDIINYVLDKYDSGKVTSYGSIIYRKGIAHGIRGACTSSYIVNGNGNIDGVTIAARCPFEGSIAVSLHARSLYKWKTLQDEYGNNILINRLYGLEGNELEKEILDMITEGMIREAHL